MSDTPEVSEGMWSAANAFEAESWNNGRNDPHDLLPRKTVKRQELLFAIAALEAKLSAACAVVAAARKLNTSAVWLTNDTFSVSESTFNALADALDNDALAENSNA